MVEAKKFGDHVTGDYLIAKSELEIGIDNDRVAMVVKDVLTDFRYVYPVGRRCKQHSPFNEASCG